MVSFDISEIVKVFDFSMYPFDMDAYFSSYKSAWMPMGLARLLHKITLTGAVAGLGRLMKGISNTWTDRKSVV